MDTNKTIKEFLNRHGFHETVADGLHEKIISDMNLGLAGEKSDQAMLHGSKASVREIQQGETAIVIDAGGTNFRSCLVTKNNNGISVSHFEKTAMPGIERNLTKEEFFKQIAENIFRLKDLSDRISFCFSYAMEITEGGDGKILKFSKEVKAHEAEGSFLGKELMAELVKQGWKRVKKINVLNDTAALLLSGILSTQEQIKTSHIAFILGTGMNSAYIHNGHIIVTECGMFNQIPQSEFDIIVDKKSSQPKLSILEKMCSGVYLGQIVHAMIEAACNEKLFSPAFTSFFSSKAENFQRLTAAHLDPILKDEGELINAGTSEDAYILKYLTTSTVLRSANLVAEAICAAVLSADKKNESHQVCIACNGSTFWKTPLLKETVESRLKKLISENFEIVQIENDITAGTFAAAFI